jgi:hypothetical protein
LPSVIGGQRYGFILGGVCRPRMAHRRLEAAATAPCVSAAGSSFARIALRGASRGDIGKLIVDRAPEKPGHSGGLVIGKIERHHKAIWYP